MKIAITSFHFPSWPILVYGRISVGSGLALAAWSALLRVAQDIIECFKACSGSL
jgi:hypothetical protein